MNSRPLWCGTMSIILAWITATSRVVRGDEQQIRITYHFSPATHIFHYPWDAMRRVTTSSTVERSHGNACARHAHIPPCHRRATCALDTS